MIARWCVPTPLAGNAAATASTPATTRILGGRDGRADVVWHGRSWADPHPSGRRLGYQSIFAGVEDATRDRADGVPLHDEVSLAAVPKKSNRDGTMVNPATTMVGEHD